MKPKRIAFMKILGIAVLAVLILLLGTFSVWAITYNEAPELAALVKAGKLPPVEKRLPKDPLVIKGFDGVIGKYGGIIHDVEQALTPPPLNLGNYLMSGTSGFTTNMYGRTIKSWEMNKGGREWLLHMREGLKWSDGEPVTADDIMFACEDYALNTELNPNPWLTIGEYTIKVEKLDDYTVRLSAPVPFDIRTSSFNYTVLTLPKHYLKQFHPKYVDKATLDSMAKKAGFESWVQLFNNKYDWGLTRNPDMPTLCPWMLVQAAPAIPVIYKRNPYYYAVDEAGNQLPYIGEIDQIFTGNEDVSNLKFIAGEADFAFTGVAMYPLLKSAEKVGKIKVYRWADSAVNSAQVEFNLTTNDPVLEKIFQDKRFRFACSYAINRKMISDLVYLGAVEPWQVAPYKTSPFYHERLAHTALEYDTEKANKLLDEMGLNKKDAAGWRLRPDGKRLTIYLITSEGYLENATKMGEIVTDNLRAVDLDVNLKLVDDKLLWEKINAADYDAILNRQSFGTNEGSYLTGGSQHFVVTGCGWINFWAPKWRLWCISGGKEGEKPSPEMLQAVEYYQKAQTTFDPQEQYSWFMKVLDIAADNLWTIGTVQRFGIVVIVNSKMKNVPTTQDFWGRGDMGSPELYFYE